MTVATPEAEETTVVTMDEEAIRVFHWRIKRFNKLGFTLWQDRSLARMGADWHAAEKLIANGCDTPTAFDLLS